MSLDSEIWIREFRIDIMMVFQPVGRTVKKKEKSRGSRTDKDYFTEDTAYCLRNASKNQCC